MASIQRILESKGEQVFSIGQQASVLDAALLMNEHKIGALIVLENDQVVGIITERDVLTRLVAQRRDPAETQVSQIMTHPVVCCRPDTSIEQARTILMRRKIRHLPVTDEQAHVHGLISIGDLNAWQIDGQEQQLHYLHEYIWGRT